MESTKVHKRLSDAVGLVAVFLALFLLMQAVSTFKAMKFIGSDVFPQSTISVSGTGEAVGVPDVARVTFTVRELRDTVIAAQQQAAEKMNGVLAQLEDLDVEETDVRTTHYSINPRYEYRQETITCVTFPCEQPPRKRVLVGQEVSQSVQVTIRDIDKAGTILGVLGDAEVANVGSLRFEIDDPDALQEEARAKAIQGAEAKAKTLADALNVTIVRVIGFDESGRTPGPFYRNAAALEFSADAEEAFVPEVPVGENTVRAQVTVTYEIAS